MKEVLKELRLRDFAKELCFVAAITLYLVNMFVGSRANKKIANKWCLEFGINNGILAEQFAYVGIGEACLAMHAQLCQRAKKQDQLECAHVAESEARN